MRKVLRRLVFVFTALVLASCGGGGGGDGESRGACGDLNLRLVGGDQCGGGPGPVVRLEKVDRDGKTYICTGTLVTNDDILTAGHCVEDTVSMRAYIGGTAYRVARGRTHPHYTHQFVPSLGITIPRGDVGMVTLESPTNVAPVPLLLSRDIQVGDTFGIYGYGDTGNGEVTTAPKGGYSSITQTFSEMFFADSSRTGADTCWGDSGGPATETVNGVTGVIGVTSWGSPECTVQGMSVYTSVQDPRVRDFILAYAPDVPLL